MLIAIDALFRTPRLVADRQRELLGALSEVPVISRVVSRIPTAPLEL